jgi:hypothetical protein
MSFRRRCCRPHAVALRPIEPGCAIHFVTRISAGTKPLLSPPVGAGTGNDPPRCLDSAATYEVIASARESDHQLRRSIRSFASPSEFNCRRSEIFRRPRPNSDHEPERTFAFGIRERHGLGANVDDTESHFGEPRWSLPSLCGNCHGHSEECGWYLGGFAATGILTFEQGLKLGLEIRRAAGLFSGGKRIHCRAVPITEIGEQ